MKQILPQKPSIIALAYTFIITIIAIILGINYTENDDWVMQSLLNGSFSDGELNIYSVFNNIVFSSTIGHLYYYFPSVEWYPLAFLSLVIVCLFILVHLIHTHTTGAKRITLFALLSLSVWFIAKLQFTIVTGYIVLTGYLLFLLASKNKLKLFLSIFLLFIASTIRFEMFILISVCILPYVVMNRFHKEKIIVLAILFVLVGSALFLNHYYYNIGDWAFFSEFNILRGRLDDNPNPINLDLILDKHSVEIYKTGSYPETATLDVMQAIYEQCKGDFFQIKFFIRTLAQYKYLVLLSTLLIMINIFSKKYWLATYILIFWAFIYYITINHYAKMRIIYPTVFVYVVLTIYHLSFKYQKYLYFIIIPIILTIHIKMEHKIIPTNQQLYNEIKQNPDKVYVLSMAYLDALTVFDPFGERLPYNVILGGWLTNIPLYNNYRDIHYSQNLFSIKTKNNKPLIYITRKTDDVFKDYIIKYKKIESTKIIGNSVLLTIKN